jgi:phosphocarrier protein FPr
MQTFSGLIAAPGIGIGVIAVYRPAQAIPPHPAAAGSVDPDAEWRRFLAAQAEVDAELEQLCANPNSLVAEIFAAHRVMLHDKTLLDAVRANINEHGENAVAATFDAIADLSKLFTSFDDEYFAGRASDILDLGRRLLARLGAQVNRFELANLPEGTILVAEDLNPSELTRLSPDRVAGIALAKSTPTAHSAILARSLGIPLACALGHEILYLLPGGTAVLDGFRGQLHAGVDAAELRIFQRRREQFLASQATAIDHARAPAVTRDGVAVPVRANANSPKEVAQSIAVGADGVGLLRTEYLFRSRAAPPPFEEQVQTYAGFLAQVSAQLTVRALDAGGDKPVHYLTHQAEDNPFLGLRGIRLLIEEPEILLTQYRALQVAAAGGSSNVEARFMLPMVSTAEEIATVQRLLSELPSDLPPLRLGAMIEVPSAALIAQTIAPLVDFFSIGTNDLSQYALASDRTNSTVARMADPLHPAVLRLIQMTCDAGRAGNKPVSLCGEISGDPIAVPLLLGLGVTELSAPLPAVPLIKETIRTLDLDDCRRLARQALACPSGERVRDLLAQP